MNVKFHVSISCNMFKTCRMKWYQVRDSEDEIASITFHVFFGPERETSFIIALTHIYNLQL